MAAQHTLRDENGLHLKIWRGMSDQWSIMLSSNTQDTVTGYISANRAAIAPICTHEDYTLILDQQFPHMQASLRRLIADAVVVRTSGSGLRGLIRVPGPSVDDSTASEHCGCCHGASATCTAWASAPACGVECIAFLAWKGWLQHHLCPSSGQQGHAACASSC